jgi:hypothetical protein
MRTDESDSVNLTNGLYNSYFAAWSPSGEYISFVAEGFSLDRFHLYRVKPDGSDLQLLADVEGNVTYSAL